MSPGELMLTLISGVERKSAPVSLDLAYVGQRVAGELCLICADAFSISLDEASEHVADLLEGHPLQEWGYILDTPERWQLVAEFVGLSAGLVEPPLIAITTH